jgi:hypothetical protein
MTPFTRSVVHDVVFKCVLGLCELREVQVGQQYAVIWWDQRTSLNTLTAVLVMAATQDLVSLLLLPLFCLVLVAPVLLVLTFLAGS